MPAGGIRTSLQDLRYRVEYGLLRFIVLLVRLVPIDVGANVRLLSARDAKETLSGGLLGRGRSRAESQSRPGLRSARPNRPAVPFFGRPAPFVTIPAITARRVGARIWMGRCIRLGKRAAVRSIGKSSRFPAVAITPRT